MALHIALADVMDGFPAREKGDGDENMYPAKPAAINLANPERTYRRDEHEDNEHSPNHLMRGRSLAPHQHNNAENQCS